MLGYWNFHDNRAADWINVQSAAASYSYNHKVGQTIAPAALCPAVLANRRHGSQVRLYWLLRTSVRKSDNSIFHHCAGYLEYPFKESTRDAVSIALVR